MTMRASSAEYAALLAELDRAVSSGPVADTLTARGDAAALLFRALARARDGLYREAREDCERALAAAPQSGLAHLVGGMVAYVTRDYDRALSLLLRTVEIEPKYGSRAYRLAASRAARLGWAEDVRAILDRAIAFEPRNLRWHLEAARVHTRGRSWEAALACLRAAVEIEPSSPALWMELAGVAACVERSAHGEAMTAVDRAIAGRRHDTAYLREAARIFVLTGAFARASEMLAQARDVDPTDAEVLVDEAELALWADDVETASALAREAHDWEPGSAGAMRVLGGSLVRRGHFDEALDVLGHAIAASPGEYRAHAFAGEALMRLDRHADAHEALTAASMCAEGFLPVAWILRTMVSLRAGNPAPRMGADRFSETWELIVAVEPRAEDVLRDGRPAGVLPLLERVLTALGGNRSTVPTCIRDGALARLHGVTGVRFESRKALELVRARGPDAALGALGRVVARFPGQSLPEAHRGELLLWLGRLGVAREALERSIAIHPETRWAYIGLTCVDILEGHAERALETSERGVRAMHGTEGPAVYVHRGEALRRAGRPREALGDLRRVRALHPSRVSAGIDLALALIEAGERDGEELRDLLAVLHDQAPGLLSDAARETGVTLWPRRDEPAGLDVTQRVLEHALTLLRGNRSSTIVTYFTGDGRLRYVPHYPHEGRGPHDTDADDLAQARTMLMRATGLTTGPRRGRAPAPAPARGAAPVGLTAADREHFLERGFVRLRGCIDRDLAREWIARANKRIRLAPARYVKGYDPSNPDHDLRGYDPDDPSTWTWERIDLDGTRSVAFADVAPRMWGATCELLGGADRIRTKSLSDYFVVNFRERADRPGLPPEEWTSWHVDDPRRDARLDDYRVGLVGICLFSDVPTGAGATYVVPGSVARVAGLLEASPDGCDLVEYDATVCIARECGDFVELTGETGDVFLLHPFMIHASSPNPSGRPRWMSNPVIHVEDPLGFDGRDASRCSPVELAVTRALGRA